MIASDKKVFSTLATNTGSKNIRSGWNVIENKQYRNIFGKI
jgi:hypothetical protein